jgi:uncharacterized protein (TIGR04255 family)
MLVDPRRHQPPLLMDSNPLVFTLGQVVIAPVLRMQSYVPDIQDKLRQQGFSRFSTMETQQLRLAGDHPQVLPQIRWIFANRESDTAVVLANDFVVVEQTTYRSFDAFVETIGIAVDVIQSIVDVDFTERLGFRRVNLIEQTPELPLREFFQPGLRGLDPARLGAERLIATLEERGETDAGQLVVRLIKPAPEAGLPPDLLATALNYRRPPADRPHALLDIDNFSTVTRDFDAAAVVEGLWELHRFSDMAFRQAVTQDALAQWGLKEHE